jgi:predicted RNA binding protein YcfA (HicA-like mRNA interferase family)
MPSARAEEFRRAASKLGFKRGRTKGGHERWLHEDGRAKTIPIHGSREIGGSLFYRIIDQLGITIYQFRRLK